MYIIRRMRVIYLFSRYKKTQSITRKWQYKWYTSIHNDRLRLLCREYFYRFSNHLRAVKYNNASVLKRYLINICWKQWTRRYDGVLVAQPKGLGYSTVWRVFIEKVEIRERRGSRIPYLWSFKINKWRSIRKVCVNYVGSMNVLYFVRTWLLNLWW